MKYQLSILLFFLFLTGCQKQVSEKRKPVKKIETLRQDQGNRNKKITPSVGLKTKILRKGPKDAPIPDIGHTVTVQYTGWIANEDETPGRQIDSSIERGQPLEFTIGLHQVIKGFEEGIMPMKIGEKRRLIIAPELGYGKREQDSNLPENLANKKYLSE